jgi:enoyl-CoA hydratase
MGEIRVETDDGVAIMSLSAPERKNALTTSMASELVAACAAIDGDPGIGAVVIRGDGGSFCAGAELGLLAAVGEDPVGEESYANLSLIYESFIRVGELRPPTIAAIHGTAVGAGLNLALVTDLRIVAQDARLVAGFLRIGAHPGGGALTMLTARAGREAAAAMAIFGEVVTGQRAVDLGLAWAVADAVDVDEQALALARRAARDPELSRLATRSLRTEAAQQLPLRTALEYERASQLWSLHRRVGGDEAQRAE